MSAPRYPGDPFGRLPHPVRPQRDPLPTEPAPFLTRRAGPLLGGPLVERRPESCRDMADSPRPVEPAGWTVLEVVGVVALTWGWLWMLWHVIDGLAGPL